MSRNAPPFLSGERCVTSRKTAAKETSIGRERLRNLKRIHICTFIIWQAPRAGSVQRILCSDWLPERARWSDTARPGLPVSFPQIKFRQSSSECTKVFFSPKLLSAKVKRFYVISLSLWNRKKRQRE